MKGFSMKKEILCQKCGNVCKPTTKKFNGTSEIGLTIPVTIYECTKCRQEHVVCPECNGNKFKINYRSDSIFEDVGDCPDCLGMGSIMIGDIYHA